jgi:methionyl-tRNA formyltransferase
MSNNNQNSTDAQDVREVKPCAFAFFGSSQMSVFALDELLKLGLKPEFVVTTPDKPVGRKQIITPNVVKTWALENKIPFYHPEKLNSDFIEKIKTINQDSSGKEISPVFLVASFGKILPDELIKIPSHGTLNIHPSLLPKYRGPSPLPSTILNDDKKTGVTIIQIDKEMDHGPIVAQKEITITEWPIYEIFEENMAREGSRLFAEILDKWINNKIIAKEQDHSQASYTKKINKEDGLLDLNADPYTNWRKIQAFHEWPQTYFLIIHNGKNLRIKITEANFIDGKLQIKKVIPEGSKEISYEDFRRGYNF